MQHREVMRCCFPSRPLSLASTRGEREAKWRGCGAECSAGPFLMLSGLPLGLTYASSSQHPEAITPAGGPIKPMLSLQWNNLNCHSHAGIFPTGGPRGYKEAHVNYACKRCMCKSRRVCRFCQNASSHYKTSSLESIQVCVCVYIQRKVS